MKVNLYGTVYRPEYEDTLLWSGELDCVPRKDDLVFPFDGWGGQRVTRVYWNLEKKPSVEIFIDDKNGEYSRQAKDLGITETKPTKTGKGR